MANKVEEAVSAGSFSRRDRAVIAAAALSMLIVQMDWFALDLMLPVIARDFGTSSTDLQWLISGYMLAIGALMIVGGRTADVHGRRRVIVIGLIVFAVMSVVCSAAQNAPWLVGARVVQGTGAALIFPVSVAVVTSYFRDARQGPAVGTVLAFSSVGTALGPFVGGVCAEHVSWRAVFLLNVPVCLAATLLVLRFVPESRDEQTTRRLDLPGAATVALGLACLMLAVDQGPGWGWASAPTLATFALGVAFLVLFVAVERRAPEPLIELSLFRKVKFDVITLAGSLSNVVYCLIAVLSALYLQQARGLTPTQAGVIFLALSCGVGAASYRAGHLALRWHAETLMACGMLTSGAALLALTWVQPLGWYAVVFVICGVGIGLGWALTNVATQAHVPAERTGAASGLVLTSLVLFGAVSVTIAATVLEAVSGSPTTAAADGPAIEAVLRGTSVLAFLGAFGLFAICRPRLRARALAAEESA
ncbi:MFS transporter [Streptomyces glebosus]|uniref:MFS transporter n=1 Tax=Streptomyces glebosus TaxID=249580 RepID=A0A640T7E4_9ACTN|nr:MFS transporter [Streptomyces glebosus]GFE18942.1 MFS transporter [Streptomyces glebosus]GHG48872.1 MFS transporter [Streptomyces glebosus]